MVACSNSSPIKEQQVKQDTASDVETDEEHSKSPKFQRVDRRDEMSFETQATVLLGDPPAILSGQMKVATVGVEAKDDAKPQDGHGGHAEDHSSQQLRPLKRKSQARADPYEVPEDPTEETVRDATKRMKVFDEKDKELAAPANIEPQQVHVDSAEASHSDAQISVEPAKSKAASDSSHEDETEEGGAPTPAPPPKRGKKRGRPAKGARARSVSSTTSGPSSRKPSKVLRTTTRTPAKSAPASQAATPSATEKKCTPKILLSASSLCPAAKSWMTKNKFKVVDETPSKRVKFVCVVRDESLPSTIKVLRTLLAGRPVVGDLWINDSRKEGELQDPNDYIHPDLEGIDIAAPRHSLFTNRVLFFTEYVVQSWGTDWPRVIEIACEAGAIELLTGKASKGHDIRPRARVILIGADSKDDRDAALLIKDHGRTVYDKAAFPKWIISAKIDLNDDDLRLKLPLGKQATSSKRKKKSK